MGPSYVYGAADTSCKSVWHVYFNAQAAMCIDLLHQSVLNFGTIHGYFDSLEARRWLVVVDSQLSPIPSIRVGQPPGTCNMYGSGRARAGRPFFID